MLLVTRNKCKEFAHYLSQIDIKHFAMFLR